MTVIINGTDITDFIAYNGLKWQRNDIDSPNTGRDMSGTMHRGRVSTKIRLDITCRPLYARELMVLLNLIYPEYVTVTYDDPMDGTVVRMMYSNNNPAAYQGKNKNGREVWTGVTFPLIEV